MSDSFDPYHQWLGIPPKDQPPNHYRLLGIDPLEDNAKVIESAADRQMTHVRTFQTGKHSAESQKLLNQIAAAKIVLLHPQKKADYDGKLKAELAAVQQKSPAKPRAKAAAPRPPALPVETTAQPPGIPEFGQFEVSGPASTQRERYLRRRRPVWFQMLTLGVLAGGLVVLFLLVRELISGDRFRIAEEEPRQTAENVTKTAQQPASVDQTPESPLKTSAAPPEKTTPPKDDPPPKTTDPGPPPPKDPIDQDHTLPPTPPPAAVKKSPVPEAADLQKMEQEIRGIFAGEYAAAETPEGKSPLAKLLLKQSQQMKQDPVARYVMLRQAVDLAAEAGETIVARDAMNALVLEYEVDQWALASQTLGQLSRSVRDERTEQGIAYSAFGLVESAVKEDRYEVAEELIEIALNLAIKLRNVELRKQAVELQKQVREKAGAWEQLQPASATLLARPDDPEANLAVGKYLCFVKGDWPAGLPHLAKGSDATLKNMAAADLAAPTEPSQWIDLADRWWDSTESMQDGPEKDAIRSRAGYWYRQAKPGLQGLTKMRVEKRIEECPELLLQPPEQVSKPEPPVDPASGPAQDYVPGMIGRAVVQGEAENDAGLVIRYQPGVSFLEKDLNSALAQANVTGRKVRVTLTGVLRVPKQMTVAIQHKGGSASGGVLRLYLDERELGAVGDDRTRNTTYSVPLAAGDHTVRWVLSSGGSLGDGFISFVDSQTDEPLPVLSTAETVAQVRAVPFKVTLDFGTY